jgi:uncharacterized protein (TIGR00255 family)
MPVYSMTGYGQATMGGAADTPDAPRFTVEVRSVNGRFLDLTLKVPDEARGLEAALRELVTQRIKRGKVELRLAWTRAGSPSTWLSPTPEQMMQVARLESTVQGYFNKAAPLSVHEVLQWTREAPVAPQSDEVVLKVAAQALESLVQAREREGRRLANSLKDNALTVRTLAKEAQPLVAQSVQRQQQRFIERWNEALRLVASDGSSTARHETSETMQERALAEAAAYALRIDVAEELTRLNAHLDELDNLLSHGSDLGKRLDFLVQELHREANTLGSKSQSLELTNLSMAMRVAIEQMREQVQNLE